MRSDLPFTITTIARHKSTGGGFHFALVESCVHGLHFFSDLFFFRLLMIPNVIPRSPLV